MSAAGPVSFDPLLVLLPIEAAVEHTSSLSALPRLLCCVEDAMVLMVAVVEVVAVADVDVVAVRLCR
jgi:hypothetical protein